MTNSNLEKIRRKSLFCPVAPEGECLMQGGAHGSRRVWWQSRRLTDHISTTHRKQKDNLKWGKAINSQSWPPVTCFLQEVPPPKDPIISQTMPPNT